MSPCPRRHRFNHVEEGARCTTLKVRFFYLHSCFLPRFYSPRLWKPRKHPPITHGELDQLVDRPFSIREVRGSKPRFSMAAILIVVVFFVLVVVFVVASPRRRREERMGGRVRGAAIAPLAFVFSQRSVAAQSLLLSPRSLSEVVKHETPAEKRESCITQAACPRAPPIYTLMLISVCAPRRLTEVGGRGAEKGAAGIRAAGHASDELRGTHWATPLLFGRAAGVIGCASLIDSLTPGENVR